MARLPDDTSLGALPNAHSGRQVNSVDMSSAGAGLKSLGAGVEAVGEAIVKSERKNDALDLAKAESHYLIETKKLKDGLSQETDPANLKSRYEPQFETVRQDAAKFIANPKVRELFLTKKAVGVVEGGLDAENRARSLTSDQEIANANKNLDGIRQSALTEQDPAKRAQYIDAGNAIISGLAESGYISQAKAQNLRTSWTQNYAVAALEGMPPEQRLNALRAAPQGREAVLDRIGGIENATGNPAARSSTSSAMGNFQFIESTWLDTIAKNRPDLAQGRSREELLALRADPKLSREMAGYLLDQNAATLKAGGVEATPGNLYLAHFLGAQSAVKALKSDPGTPAVDIVGQKAVDANQSVLQGKTIGTVVAWADRKMGGAKPGSGELLDFIPEDRRRDLAQKAQYEILTEQRKADAASALDTFNVKTMVKDDIESMGATGRGVDGVSGEKIKSVLGDAAYQEWMNKREDAHSTWVGAHDMPSLTDAQINQRLADFAPQQGQKDFARRQAVYEALRDTAEKVRQMRIDDPANSVSNDPTVLEASKSGDRGALIAARLAAQERAGIPEDGQSPITKSEALAISAPLRRVLPGQEREVLTSIADDLKKQYGEHAEAAFEYVVRSVRTDAATSQAAARILRKLAFDEPVSSGEGARADTNNEIAKADGITMRSAVDAGAALMAPLMPGAMAGYGVSRLTNGGGGDGVNIPAGAINDLRRNPDLAADFDRKYGDGRAKSILEKYTKKPGNG